MLAKSTDEPGGKISIHSVRVAGTTRELLDRPGVTRPFSQVNITRERLARLGELAGLLHDLGKAHPAWQTDCREVMNGTTDRIGENHSKRSALIAYAVARDANPLDLSEVEQAAVVLAVLHHHTKLAHRNMQLGEGTDKMPTDGLSELRQNASSVLPLEGPTVTVGTVPEIDIELAEDLAGLTKVLRNRKKSNDGVFDRLSDLVPTIRAALVQADHHESSRIGRGDTAGLPEVADPDRFQLYDDLRPYQRKVDRVNESGLVGLAGCGEGKTHSALQWGQEMLEKNRAERLVFAMPTRVTTNNLLLELADTDTSDGHVPAEDIALNHSDGNEFYRSAADERDLVLATEQERRWFRRPVTVTTVDHVLNTLINNYSNADVARENLKRCAVVFDELHAYDTVAAGNIVSAIRELDRLGVPWYVMTATLPPELDESLPDASRKVVSDGRTIEGVPRRPFNIRVESDGLDYESVGEEIPKTADRAMVVKNTVREAQLLADRLRDDSRFDVTYYSSEFPQHDRRHKEEAIRDSFDPESSVKADSTKVLVCTQICEISLDISVDTLLTDIAPVDAIIQRAGRLHRRGTHPTSSRCHGTENGCSQCETDGHEYECVVYAPIEDAEAFYPYADDESDDSWRLLERTAEILGDADTYSFGESREWIDSVYSEFDIDPDATTFASKMRHDALFGDARWEDPDAVREINSFKMNVLAETYVLNDGRNRTVNELWEEFHDGDCVAGDSERCLLEVADSFTDCHRDLDRFVTKYAVPVPAYWIQSNIDCSTRPFRGVKGVQVVDLDYTYETGLISPVASYSHDQSRDNRTALD